MQVKLADQGIFSTLQGEGLATGLPCIFVRLQGCHKRCSWCDTPDALDMRVGGYFVEVDDLAKQLMRIPVRDIVFTGGEPMLQAEALNSLIPKIGFKKFHIETSGDIFNPVLELFNVVTFSPKLPSSGYDLSPLTTRSMLALLHTPAEPWRTVQFKFVVSDMADLEAMWIYLQYLDYPGLPVVIQAEESKREEIEELLFLKLTTDTRYHAFPMQFRYMRRLHKDMKVL